MNFYCNSVIIPSLIIEYFNNLYFKKITTYKWKVTALGMTELLQAQYMIEPEINTSAYEKLSLLQSDVKKIANCLHDGIKQNAVSRLEELKKKF